MLKYTLRLAHLELGGVDLDLAVEDVKFFHSVGLNMTLQFGVEREIRSGGNPPRWSHCFNVMR